MTDDVPIVVDLDGTLIGVDSLRLLRARLLLHKPWLEQRRRAAYRRGKQFEKLLLWDAVPLDVSALPVNARLIDALDRSDELFLATGSSVRLARAVASHLGCFADVLGTDESVNLTGEAKAKSLADRFGSGGFDYVGDSWADLPVWREARRAYVCSEDPELFRAVADATSAVRVPCRMTGRLAWWRLVLRRVASAERPT